LKVSKTDEIYVNVKEFIENGWPKDSSKFNGELRKLYLVRIQLSMYRGLIVYGSRLYIPMSLRSR